MRKNILIHGLIAGLVVSILMIFNVNYISHTDGISYDTSLILGYVSMLIALSLVYVGIRNYRDKYNGGVISFGKAFKVGILIVLIAATFYVVAWLIDYYFFIPDFMDKYSAHMIDELKASGATQAQIDAQANENANLVTMLKNPFFNALMAYAEILPVGLVVTVISALILKRKTARN